LCEVIDVDVEVVGQVPGAHIAIGIQVGIKPDVTVLVLVLFIVVHRMVQVESVGTATEGFGMLCEGKRGKGQREDGHNQEGKPSFSHFSHSLIQVSF
jgi:hypothetical protein